MNISALFRLLMASCMATLPCMQTPAAARNYYIDARDGSDSYAGTSSGSPWKTLAKASSVTLNPGDSLLLRRGEVFNGILSVSPQGREDRRITISAYGEGDAPVVEAPDNSRYAVMLENPDFVTLSDLEIVNHGTTPMAGRTGVLVSCVDFGVAHDIILDALTIRDVNGSLVKAEGGGSGILIVNGGKDVPSWFDGLTVENCVITRCERNGMIWSAYHDRSDWHPNRNVVIRKNLIEGVPGDGIVPIGCDGALVEYNLMRGCPGTLPHSEAAAGFWPWSCDNTTIRFNEVCGHKAPWDAQGFDSDYNCTNTTISYNYSHDNDGGMVLICNSGKAPGEGNKRTTVEYNVSINDAVRPRATRNGIFAPAIHIAGPVENTTVRRNIIHVNPKAEPFMDRCLITSDSWDGYADSTLFQENVFFTPHESSVRLGESTRNRFEGNYFLGHISGRPDDPSGRDSSERYNRITRRDPEGFGSLGFLFDTVTVGNGAAVMKAVNPRRIALFFDDMKTGI